MCNVKARVNSHRHSRLQTMSNEFGHYDQLGQSSHFKHSPLASTTISTDLPGSFLCTMKSNPTSRKHKPSKQIPDIVKPPNIPLNELHFFNQSQVHDHLYVKIQANELSGASSPKYSEQMFERMKRRTDGSVLKDRNIGFFPPRLPISPKQGLMNAPDSIQTDLLKGVDSSILHSTTKPSYMNSNAIQGPSLMENSIFWNEDGSHNASYIAHTSYDQEQTSNGNQ